MNKLAIFRRKHWTPFETSLRHHLVSNANNRGIGMKEYLYGLAESRKYPEQLETPYQVFLAISVNYPDELEKFRESHKKSLGNQDVVQVCGMYLLYVMSHIFKDYGLDLQQIAKPT